MTAYLQQCPYISLSSTGHRMAISIHKKNKEDPGIWSFYNPNMGSKVVDSYQDFRNFIDKLYEVWPVFGYTFEQCNRDSPVKFQDFFAGDFDEKKLLMPITGEWLGIMNQANYSVP